MYLVSGRTGTQSVYTYKSYSYPEQGPKVLNVFPFSQTLVWSSTLETLRERNYKLHALPFKHWLIIFHPYSVFLPRLMQILLISHFTLGINRLLMRGITDQRFRFKFIIEVTTA